jgi:hypothetical protein
VERWVEGGEGSESAKRGAKDEGSKQATHEWYFVIIGLGLENIIIVTNQKRVEEKIHPPKKQ